MTTAKARRVRRTAARRSQKSKAVLMKELAARGRQLRELVNQQRAVSEILRSIANLPSNIGPVFETIAESAAYLCNARFCQVFRFDGRLLHFAATFGLLPEAVDDIRRAYPMPPGRASAAARAVLLGEVAQIPDVHADPDYARASFVKLMNFRSIVAVPMLKDGRPIGAIAMGRRRFGTFPRRHVELLRGFADQAVIAVENARLFDELQSRTRDLNEALEQQKATAEILRVISTSPHDTQPVFETIVQNAVTLTGSLFANVFRFDGEMLHFVASHNVGPSYVELLRSKYPMRPDLSQISGRVCLTNSVIRLEDVLTDPDYDQRFPQSLGWRRMLGVPMLREGNLLGVIVVGWAEPGPVSKNQEDLLKTFADQAVLAIENVRLFDEIQDKSRQLELANKYKSHYLASASHDLRQPLHALNLFVAQLQGESDPVERTRLVERVGAAVGAMNELFESLLDMSRLEADILEPNFTEFPVQHLLDRVETTFANAARDKGLRLGVVRSGAWIRSDLVLLERILLNLVSNAVRYTVNGGVVIGCRRRGNGLRIDICDTGSGIPSDQRQNIFREFYQLPAAVAESRSGIGLGLAIVDRLCSLLCHAIDLNSHLGRGSRFSVSVPLAARVDRADELTLSSAVSVDPVHNKIIVVIDDDPLVLTGMCGILQSWNCRVLTAGSVEGAVYEVAALGKPPDVIISDYRLANGQTGIEAIERLRAACNSVVPALLISGDTAPKRLRDASASGLQLLHKPVTPIRLRAVLHQLVKSSLAEERNAQIEAMAISYSATDSDRVRQLQ